MRPLFVNSNPERPSASERKTISAPPGKVKKTLTFNPERPSAYRKERPPPRKVIIIHQSPITNHQ